LTAAEQAEVQAYSERIRRRPLAPRVRATGERRVAKADIAGLTDERTISQLASILYEHDARGRVAIENKDDARKRGVKSPDRAEAVMLAFATPALGWTLLDVEPEVDEWDAGSQIRDGLPFDIRVYPAPTCGECAHFSDGAAADGAPERHGQQHGETPAR
jgi:hypothetical protein